MCIRDRFKIKAMNEQRKPRYEYTQGNAAICCNRCIIKTHQPLIYCFIFFLALALPFATIFGLITRLESSLLKYLFLGLVIVLDVVALALYCFTAFSDPGILPRRLDAPEYTEAEKRILVNGKTIELKVCVTCNIIRPPRSFHCGQCGVCVDVHGSLL
eukprot:TRINITY_DN11237_c0_g1_i3.p1 TRINITY_DN11237_c0_g1~~TRINITY_DN11237_c0_g1_i3.p1  ORF type:complete len:158 (-),score=16.75 TRINITY_DN11237_c0_g1_i3:102-575(-)